MRSDIQALRGYAVLLVVLSHAGFTRLKAGYLGVDIFFVISGYLITRLVKNGIDAGGFSFLEFYTRRLRRLLPAAYTTFLFTALASAYLLNAAELRDFGNQLLGALTFSANFVLWQQSGYFDGAAQLKPLLHVWSLAIEEQYYLLMPVSLVFVPRRFWVGGAWFLLFSSLGLCLYFAPLAPAATFYLMPMRAWELAIGSIGALTLEGYSWESFRFRDQAYWASVLALLLTPVVPVGSFHPGLDALIVCVATLCIILAKKESLANELPSRILGWFGDISYSLYLVHWPLFALLNNIWFGPEPAHLRHLVVVVAVFLAYLQFRFIENPIRRSHLRLTPKTVGWVLAVSLAIAAIPSLAMLHRGGEPDFVNMRRSNRGLGDPCTYPGEFAPQPACQTSPHPTILVWGDSFAMQFIPGMVQHRDGQEIAQATRSVCPPTLGLAAFERGSAGIYNRQYAERCTDFNEAVVRYLSTAGSPQIVVIGGNFGSFMWTQRRLLEDRTQIREVNLEVALLHLKRTVDTLRSLGKRVVIVSPVPGLGLDLGRCNERILARRLIAGPNSDCGLSLAAHRVWNGPLLALFTRIQREAGVDVIGFEDLLCDTGVCRSMWEGKMLYRDDLHLTHDGSEIVARRSDLVGQILAKAR
ncbi:MAG: acyltransferase family protein [Acidobacteriota bacterium]